MRSFQEGILNRPKNNDMINLERLINTGKDKGYITYEELNDDLSDEIVSSEEHIDDLMMMFEELDIMVIDEASKGEIAKAQAGEGKKKAESQEKENQRLDIPDTSTRVSDPREDVPEGDGLHFTAHQRR